MVAQRIVAFFGALRTLRPTHLRRAAHVAGTAEPADIVQEAFLRLWTKAAQFHPGRGPFRDVVHGGPSPYPSQPLLSILTYADMDIYLVYGTSRHDLRCVQCGCRAAAAADSRPS